MAKPKLAVSEVWILEEVEPYDGSEILGVFVDPEVGKAGRKGRWQQLPGGEWSTKVKYDQTEPWLLLSKHTIRTK